MKLKYLFIVVISFAGILSSCKKDTTVDPYAINYVYLSNVKKFGHFTIYTKGEFLTPKPELDVLLSIRCTKPAPNDLSVDISIDPSLIEKYNKDNKSQYKLFEGAELKSKSIIIKKGEYFSADSIKVVYSKPELLLNSEDKFILPIRIACNSNGVSTSKKYNAVYITYSAKELMVDIQRLPPTGKKIEIFDIFKTFTGEDIASQNPEENRALVTDGQITTILAFDVRTTKQLGLDIDLKEVKKLSSISLAPFYRFCGVSPKYISIQVIDKVGEDAKVIKTIDSLDLPYDVYGSTDIQGAENIVLKLMQPVETQYIRLLCSGIIDSAYSKYPVGFCDMSLYSAE